MFDPVDPKQSFPALERGILTYWKEEDIFKRSIKQRKEMHGDILEQGPKGQGRKSQSLSYSFYDGPPFATGLPHYGHLLAGTIKDVIPRYQTMRGHAVERRFGWDCHGLPIENLIEKEHNITSHKQIEEMGIAAFNALCRASVQRYTKEWRDTVERMGRFVDMDHDYRTMDPEFMESIWWVFSELQKKGLIYEGHKPMHICPRCVTPLSNFEVTQGYQDVTDQSVTAMFALEDEPDTYVLAWTTTPWTLPGNLFLAVHPDVEYVTFAYEGKKYIVAEEIWNQRGTPKSLLASTMMARAAEADHQIPSTVGSPIKGKKLMGKHYKPLFPYFVDRYKGRAFRIVTGDFVTTTDGTGIVHIAPGFGTDDFEVGQREGITDVLSHICMDGTFIDEVTDFAGMSAKPKDDPTKTDQNIIDWLANKGLVFTRQTFRHSYPHCWRCDSPLLNYATSSWFVSVEKIKKDLLANNAKTRWVPDHIRTRRFGNWLENARDWAISRNRYWGTPLPIWRTEGHKGQGPRAKDARTQGNMEVIGSRDDLMAKCRIRFTKVTVLRHAESEGNTIPVYQGNVPGTSLTKRGKDQAKIAADFIANSQFSILNSPLPAVIYASPLARTQETAAILAKKTGAKVITDNRLREVSFGDYEGKHVDFSDLTFVKERRAHKLESGKSESVYHFEGMETWASVHDRVASFLKEVLPHHRSEHIVIVTHADPVMNIRAFFSGTDPVKLSHQPYPQFSAPESYFWDHDHEAALDLHRETIDAIAWPGAEVKGETVQATFVRHGQTDWNRDAIMQGQEGDRSLTDLGKKQAEETAKLLKNQKFDGIVCSDLKRTVETADIIAKALGLPILETSPLLRERSIGEWAGKPASEVLDEFPLPVAGGEDGVHHVTPPGGESLSQFLRRAELAAEHMLAQYPGKKILVVTHGGMIRAMLCVTENISYMEAVATSPKNGEAAEIPLHPRFHRIPEVLDCWFESGSMPYAQQHYPFAFSSIPLPLPPQEEGELSFTSKQKGLSLLHANSKQHTSPSSRLPTEALLAGHSFSDGWAQVGGGGVRGGGPPGFPADFIAEGIDQTRGWFYTLSVLSTALFNASAFKNCIVNGIVLAEDGKKMSKRLKNYPEPTEVAEKHGADAVRFSLMRSPAVRGEDLRFSEKLVEEAVRSVILPLWNTYSFFVTYANAANWKPTETRRKSTHPLDRWITSEIQDLVNRMTEQLDAYDLSATCAELGETIDALTNWYVRLSRRRFAGKGLVEAEDASGDRERGEQHDALMTLYDVLLTLSQVLAPFCPFTTDAIYLNLVSEEHGSIHLTDWPETRELSKDERAMIEKHRFLRLVVSLGNSIRSKNKIKTRQPLARITVAIPKNRKSSALTAEDQTLLQQELNVKEIALADDPGKLAQIIALVDARKVGPRLGKRVQEVIAAGKRGEFTQKEDGSVLILDEVMTGDEVQIQYRGAEGTDVAAGGGIVVSLDTNVTPVLEAEGLARDLIREIQKLRKDTGLAFTDKIALQVSGIDEIVNAFKGAIAEETRANWMLNTGKLHIVNIEGTQVSIQFECIKEKA